jgi:hypothetical protein
MLTYLAISFIVSTLNQVSCAIGYRAARPVAKELAYLELLQISAE